VVKTYVINKTTQHRNLDVRLLPDA